MTPRPAILSALAALLLLSTAALAEEVV